MDNFEEDVTLSNIVKHMKESKYTVVLTGAGMSTASGIPDFRGKNGTYSKYPSDIFSHESFKNNPDKFYEAFNDKFKSIVMATPNEGHYILKKWEDKGIIHCIATQNIDQLHLKAGNKHVYELHGSIAKFIVNDKNDKYYEFPLSEVLNENNTINYRQKINEREYILKPDIVLFGEHPRKYNEVYDLVKKADFMIVLGTSLQVYPFANLPNIMRKKSWVGIVNKTAVYISKGRNLPILGEVTSILKKIDTLL